MRIERQASSLAPVGAAGCAGILSGAGVGVALATLANRIFPLPDQNAPEIPAPDAASADDLPPAATRPVQWIVGILVLMLVPAISTLVFFIVGAFILDTKETGSSMALSFTLTGQAMGVVLGCLGFFYSIVPGAGIWPDWVRQMAREMNRSDDPLPRFRQYDSIFKVVVLGLAGMATVVNSFYVMIVIFSWFNQTQPVFIYFVPWIALAIFAFIMVDKMNAPI